MWSLCLVLSKWIVIILLIKGITGLKLVSLNVPEIVKKGSEVQLSCLYDLENETLYSLKWFYRANDSDREEQEFFRYTPRGKNIKQVFPLEGIKVNYLKSEGGNVIIDETNGKTSGNYKCEISIEGTFQTIAAEKFMTVEVNRASLLTISMGNQFILTLCAICAITSWIISLSFHSALITNNCAFSIKLTD